MNDAMKQKEHFRNAVYQTPFHPRTSALNTLNEWHRWKDYTIADAYFDVALEYAAIRNACAVFDLTPMTKHRITGPDALAFLNRLVTRDVAKIKPGKVGYCVWCDDNGQVIDDGTIFHLKRGDYRLCSQERQLEWLDALGLRLRRPDRRGHARRRLPRACRARRAAPCSRPSAAPASRTCKPFDIALSCRSPAPS